MQLHANLLCGLCAGLLGLRCRCRALLGCLGGLGGLGCRLLGCFGGLDSLLGCALLALGCACSLESRALSVGRQRVQSILTNLGRNREHVLVVRLGLALADACMQAQ